MILSIQMTFSRCFLVRINNLLIYHNSWLLLIRFTTDGSKKWGLLLNFNIQVFNIIKSIDQGTSDQVVISTIGRNLAFNCGINIKHLWSLCNCILRYSTSCVPKGHKSMQSSYLVGMTYRDLIRASLAIAWYFSICQSVFRKELE